MSEKNNGDGVPPAARQAITLGTRGSALALAQAELTVSALRRAFPNTVVTVRKITTSGDRKLDMSLVKQTPAGAKGLFTKELEDALLRREIDVAVHSCKDLPGEMPEGLVLAATLERASTADVLLTKSVAGFHTLPNGAHIGTSSVRRARQLLFRRPDLLVEEIRGNVATRLRKLRESTVLEGIVLARAGLDRLGFRIDEGRLDFEDASLYAAPLEMLPAIGQGAIALQTRSGDAPHFAVVNHEPTWLAIRAERELMRLLQGDCTLPVGVATELFEEPTGGSRTMKMRVILFSTLGKPPRQAEVQGRASTPEALAAAAFRTLTS